VAVERGSGDLEDARELVLACAEGDPRARRAFQERFAEDVYNFPVKIYGLPADKAADFYVYAFERDRIFVRLRTFEGRAGIQLRTFLSFHVLRALFLDWQRGNRELDTVSLSTPLRRGGEEGAALEDVLSAPDEDAADDAPEGLAELWESLAPEERLDLKLLSLLEHDLTADELRLLARLSRRPVEETLDLVLEVQTALRAKGARLASLAADVDSAWGWLVLRRRELQEIDEKIRLLGPGQEGATRQRLLERRRELEAAIEKRSLQHARTLDEMKSYKVTTPYKDIARLKGSTVGTVCSRIFRLRQRLEERCGAGGEGNT
jgi:RNA polymerase sigma factor (sigma-70 family)